VDVDVDVDVWMWMWMWGIFFILFFSWVDWLVGWLVGFTRTKNAK